MPVWVIAYLLTRLMLEGRAEIAVSTACPGEQLRLICPLSSQRLVIRQAEYYGPEVKCGTPSMRRCVHPDPLGGLARSCFGKTECIINTANKAEVFSERNPCQDVAELYASVVYDCVEGEAMRSICDRDAISWPPRGYVTSEKYPDKYMNGQACGRALRGREGQVVTISMLDLQMEFSADSAQCYDFVVFKQDGNDQSSRKFCGTKVGSNFKYSLIGNDRVNVFFESSIETNFRGFLFEYKVEGCPRDEVPPAPANGRLTSFSNSEYVIYECDVGYQKVAPNGQRVNCSKDGLWVGDPGYCVPVRVPEPPTTTSTDRPTTTTISTTTLQPTTTTTATTTTTTTASTTTSTTTTKRPSVITPSPRPMAPSVGTPITTMETVAPPISRTPVVPSTSTKKTTVVEVSLPVWAMQPLPGTASTTKISPVEPTAMAKTTSSGLDVPIIGAIVGGLALSLLLGIAITFIIVRRRFKAKKQEKSNGLSSLRPSAHACVSIPNTYGGVGNPAAKSASYSSSHSQHSKDSAIATLSSSSKRSNRKSNISDSISYESDLYAAESLKGSADPILTQSATSFDCVDVSRALGDHREDQVVRVQVAVNPPEGYVNPVGAFYAKDEKYAGQKSHQVANGHVPHADPQQGPLLQDSIDSGLLYTLAKPSLETIREEQESDMLTPTPTGADSSWPTLSTSNAPRDSLPEESVSEFDFGREEADGESFCNSELVAELDIDDVSVRTMSSEVRAKVGKRRIRTRPISMGEADQPESKRRIDKVEYGLFKDDVTGNLGNFLEHRRVSV